LQYCRNNSIIAAVIYNNAAILEIVVAVIYKTLTIIEILIAVIYKTLAIIEIPVTIMSIIVLALGDLAAGSNNRSSIIRQIAGDFPVV